MGWLSSVHCLPRGHISETKHDRPIVTMEHYWEVGITDSIATFRAYPRFSHGEIFSFQIEDTCKY